MSIRPPANVWRHLRELTGPGTPDAKSGKSINIQQVDTWWYVLECLKAMYGLNDAPLAWQLNLQEYLVRRGGIQSFHFDVFRIASRHTNAS